MKNIIIILMALVMITSTLGLESLGNFERYKDIELIQICSNCSFVNISTIRAPNSTIIYTDLPMTKNGARFNYSLRPLDYLGNYQVCGVADVEGTYTSWCYDFNLIEAKQPYNSGMVRHMNLFNFDLLDVTTPEGVTMFIFLFIVMVVIIALSEYLRMGFVAVLSALYSLFYGFLVFSYVSVMMGIVFIAVGLMYFFRALIFTNEK